MTTARTLAQAKINLFLHVLDREASGYHQLETLFCRLELGDDVVVRTHVRGYSLDVTGDVVPPDGLGPVEQNLAWRAAKAFTDTAGWPNAWAIEIDKRIPVGGGLGGGSADAGAVLRCLNAIAPTPLPRSALLEIATSLGADVPFLAIDEPLALGRGRGERLLALGALPARDVLLVCFPFGVATRDAYGWLDADRAGASEFSLGQMRTVDAVTSWADVARIAHNDFGSVVVPRFDAIATALATLQAAAARRADRSAIAMLAGSGATVFLVTDGPDSTASERIARSGIASRTVMTRTATRVVDVEVSD